MGHSLGGKPDAGLDVPFVVLQNCELRRWGRWRVGLGSTVTLRRVAMLAVLLCTGLGVQGARADDHWVWTPAVTAGADSDNLTVYVDFSESTDPLTNPVPYHGYAIVHGDGTVTCGPTDGPRAADGTASPNFVDSHQCNPLADHGGGR